MVCSMDFDNIDDLGVEIFKAVRETYYDMEASKRGPLLYSLCSVFGSLNYAPERAKDCDILVMVPPAMTEAVKKEDFGAYTYKGLSVDYKITCITSLDVCEAIELASVINDESKSSLWSKPTIDTQMPLKIENFYKVVKNKMNDKSVVRREVSKKCSNSFVKAKKKLLVEKDFDPYVSMKSLWHSIRMYEFANQFAKAGEVYDFESCNKLFEEIRQDYENHSVHDMLELITSKYKPKQNRVASVFKLNFPK